VVAIKRVDGDHDLPVVYLEEVRPAGVTEAGAAFTGGMSVAEQLQDGWFQRHERRGGDPTDEAKVGSGLAASE
jgi:hypothetical protein